MMQETYGYTVVDITKKGGSACMRSWVFSLKIALWL